MKSLSTRLLIRVLMAIVLLVCVGVAVSFAAVNLAGVRYAIERTEFQLQPSADRAYTFGMRHFDASHGADYDLARASYFLQEAIILDPRYPLAHLQLARIQFLNANFSSAIALINQEIALTGDATPSSYYIRGLAEGYAGFYTIAAADFSHFLQLKPDVWAGYNDESWVLMKGGNYESALGILILGLSKYPDNAWILNSYAIALYETGDTAGAKQAAMRAKDAVAKLTPADWSKADPGNDPRVAQTGLDTFKAAAAQNMDKILQGSAPATIDAAQ